MKKLFALLLVALTENCRCDVLLTDTFDGTSPEQWSEFRPYSNSVLGRGNGDLTLRTSGGIITQSTFVSPITVSGSFMNTGQRNAFAITLRSNGTYTYGSTFAAELESGGFYGVSVLFYAGGYYPNNRVAIRTDPDYAYNLWSQSFSMPTNENINFKIIDSGTAISIEVNNTPLGGYQTTYSVGSKIGLMALGTPAYQSNDNIVVANIEIIPEPSSLSLLVAGLAVLMAGRRRK